MTRFAGPGRRQNGSTALTIIVVAGMLLFWLATPVPVYSCDQTETPEQTPEAAITDVGIQSGTCNTITVILVVVAAILLTLFVLRVWDGDDGY